MYPTYDPFAPINGDGSQIAPVPVGDVMQPLRTPLRVNAPSALAAIAVDVDAAVDAVAVARKAA